MNKKTSKTQDVTPGQGMCQSLGPALSELRRRLRPPEDARRHFETARLEILKGLRALLDARIERRSKSRNKGEKIPVE